jgi:hypothetical protein
VAGVVAVATAWLHFQGNLELKLPGQFLNGGFSLGYYPLSMLWLRLCIDCFQILLMLLLLGFTAIKLGGLVLLGLFTSKVENSGRTWSVGLCGCGAVL